MKKYYKFEVPVKKFWTIGVPGLFILLILCVIAGFLLVDKVVMPRVTNIKNRGDVEVPNLVGMSAKDATALLYDKGLHLSVGEKEYSDKPEKEILLQQPTPGKKVKSGRHIFVTVSRGPEVAELPSVKELAEGPAKTVLRKAGFFNIEVKQKYHKSIERNLAITTDPMEKLSTSREATINLYISKGPEPTHAVVPNLVGEMLSVAEEKLTEVELKVGSVTYTNSSVMSPGQIVSQSVSPGANVSLNSKVSLVVSAQ